jgi:hypothetical protein
MNDLARNLILYRLPQSVAVHDWWIYLVVSAFGVTIYDQEPKILYRQHGSNAIGVKSSTYKNWAGRVKRFVKQDGRLYITKQAKEFDSAFGSLLDADKKRLLHRLLHNKYNFLTRIRYAFSSDLYRQARIDTVILKFLIVLNRC